MALSVIHSGTVPMTTVGERIIEARKAKDMTQLDLAKRLGVSRAAVGQWEINATSPSIAKLEEVAMILNVEPQWLAYNVKPGEARVVYRSPERDNIHWVTELVFGDSADDVTEGDKWGIPAEYLTRELHSSVENTAICTVNSHAVEPDYEYGDKVFIDRSDRKPSPAGIFVFWDGIGMAFARMQAIPGSDPKVRITQQGADAYDMAFGEVEIIGRVKGRVQRG
ncbi:transcriptional repressor [Bacteriophage DSS3_MAL1]|nr:transcriptional repressor [Bacteriophage DSS3_MAL1]